MTNSEFIESLGSLFNFSEIGSAAFSLVNARKAILSEVKALVAAQNPEELRQMRCRTGALTSDEGSKSCNHILVPIPEFIFAAGGIYEFDPSHPEYGINENGERCLSLDEHIVPAIKALWSSRIVTRSCCCGHGCGWGIVTVLPECAS